LSVVISDYRKIVFLCYDDNTIDNYSQCIGTSSNQLPHIQETKEDSEQDHEAISFKKGDYMIVHSTLKGYVSNRHKEYGTIFIQEMTKSINELMRYENHNFEEVIRRTCFAASSHRHSGINASQLPEFTTTLRAPFRFTLKEEFKVENTQIQDVMGEFVDEKQESKEDIEEGSLGLRKMQKLLCGTRKRQLWSILISIGILTILILVPMIPRFLVGTS